MRLVDKVKRNLNRCDSTGSGGALVIAASGGLDSMCLLDLVHRAFGGDRRLVVAHFNHGLRGDSGDADEVFVRAAAETLHLEYVADRADVQAMSGIAGVSVEMAAREVRHRFLARVARELDACAVLLAHHADDQIETFFLRVLRGGGSGALGGMAMESASPFDPSVHLVRPLLDVTRVDLEAHVADRGLEFREDASNQDVGIPRNRVRRSLLPFLEREFGPGFLKTVPRICESLRDDDAYIRSEADRWTREPAEEFPSLPKALSRAILAAKLRRMGVEPDFDLLERLLGAPWESTISGSGDVLLRLSASGELSMMDPPGSEIDAPVCREIVLDRESSLRVGRVRLDVLSYPGREEARLNSLPAGEHLLDLDKTGPRLSLRGWKPGDRMQPLGMSGLKKLQDIFIDAKVAAMDRRKRLLLSDPYGRICWLEGFRIADWARVDEGTRRILKVRTADGDESD